MKCLFCHDLKAHKFNNVYYSYNLSYDILKERYLSIFDEIVMCTREVVCTDSIENKLVLTSGDGISFQPIRCYKGPKSLFLNKHKINMTMKVIIENIDCAIIRLPSVLGNIAIRECIRQGKPYLVESVACPWDAYWNYSLSGKFFAPIMTYKTKKAILSSKYTVYVTETFLQGRYPTKGESIACSDVLISNMSEEGLEKRKIKINNDSNLKIIGTTAAVNVKSKGQQYVIKALGILKKDGITGFKYQLVGSGDNSYLKEMAKKYDVENQVEFLGAMQHDDVLSWLESIDIYIQPSRQEGLPRALIEAMSRAVPSIGARTAGIPELLEDDCIFNNSNNTSYEISELLKRLEPEKLQRISEANYKKAQEYGKSKLDKKRYSFYNKFKEYVVAIKN